MRNDATEAALGLLGLNSAFDTVSTVPLKRKQSSSSSHALDTDTNPGSGESISCICGFTYDDGFSIGCDSCYRWCHAACFGIVETEVPEEWLCWVCNPRHVDKERAVKLQKARQRATYSLEMERQKRRVSPGVDRKGRRTSAATIDGSGQSKRKRRPSIISPQHAEDEHVDIDEPWTHSYLHVDKDVIPHDETREKLRRVATHWRGVTAIDRVSASPTTPTVLPPGASPSSSRIHLRPLHSPSDSPLSLDVDQSIRPPSYAAHATRPIASSEFIAPFRSSITPSASYLSDPLNAYAHLSMPKPFVHLMGPPLDVALDARLTGNQARFVRNGCRPNAVLRPVLCPRSRKTNPTSNVNEYSDSDEETLTFGIFALRDLKAHEEIVLGWEWDDGSVIHHLPALIDNPHIFPPHELQHLRHQLISMLHTLSSTFTTCACGCKAKDCALLRIAEFVDGQSPPTPAPSPPTSFIERVHGIDGSPISMKHHDHDSATNSRPKKTDLGPLIGVERGFRTRERLPGSGGMMGVEMASEGSSKPSTHGSRSVSSPMMIMTADSSRTDVHRRAASLQHSTPHMKPSSTASSSRDRKGKGRAIDLDQDHSADHHDEVDEEDQMDVDDRLEEHLPPKLRKGWIRKSYDTLRESAPPNRAAKLVGEVVNSIAEPSDLGHVAPMEVDGPIFDPREMPPPPAIPSRNHPPLSVMPQPSTTMINDGQISPSIAFANLSLLSPATAGPSSYFRRSSSPLNCLDKTEDASNEHAADLLRHPADMSSPDPSDTKCSRRSTPPRPLPSPSQQGPKPVVAFSRASEELLAASTSSTTFQEGSNEDMQDHGVNDTSMSIVVDLPSASADVLWNGERGTPLKLKPEPESEPEPQSSAAAEPSKEPPTLLVQTHPSPISSVSAEPSNEEPTSQSPLFQHSLLPPVSPEPPCSTSLHVPAEPSCPLSPPAPAQPAKMKISFKDFAARKKKQREEEMVKAQSSPSTQAAPLQTQSLPFNEFASLQTSSSSDSVPLQTSSADSMAPQLHTSPTSDPAPLPIQTVPLSDPTSLQPAGTAATHSGTSHIAPESAESSRAMDVDNGGVLDVVKAIAATSGGTQDDARATEQNSVKTAVAGDEDVIDKIPTLESASILKESLSKAARGVEASEDRMSVDPSSAPAGSLQTKVEMIESRIPSPSIRVEHESPKLLLPEPLPRTDWPHRPPPRAPDPTRPTRSVSPVRQLARQVSQEDGEILSPPSKAPFAPRAYSPPTHPRSFHSGATSPGAPVRRPLQPAMQRSAQNGPTPSRPMHNAPSAPRALRVLNHPVYPPPSPRGPPPRGPSADRDRMDWDRDRSWAGPSRGRGRGGWIR